MTTTSAVASRAGISSSPTARDSTRAASSSPCARVRFATAAIAAPRERRFRAVSSLILPAPTSRTAGPSRSPKTCWASAAAAAGTDAGLSPIAVSTRARRPACSACRKRRSSSGPVAPHLERVAHLAEDLALARDERVETGRDAEEVQRGTVVAEPVENRGERGAVVARRARAATRSPRSSRSRRRLVAREVELGSVAGREHDGLAAVGELARERAPRAVGVDGDPLPQLDGCLAVRDADERESHEAKWVRGRTTATSANPATSSTANRRPRRPSLAAQEQARRVERPDRERDGHRARRSRRARSCRARRRCRPRGRGARSAAVRAESRSSDSSGGSRRRSTPASRCLSRRSCQR